MKEEPKAADAGQVKLEVLTADGREMGTVAKKWAGLAKEMFTSADNYVINLNDSFKQTETANMLLLAAGLAVDLIYKEGN